MDGNVDKVEFTDIKLYVEISYKSDSKKRKWSTTIDHNKNMEGDAIKYTVQIGYDKN